MNYFETDEYKRYEERYKEEHSIKCPHCGYDYSDDCEFYNGLVTYWAEDEPQERECYGCENKFWVEEKVDRTWKKAKTLAELDEIL